MAYETIFGTGFEVGSVEIFPAVDRNGLAVTTNASFIKTGNYAGQLTESGGLGHATVHVDESDIYASVWYLPGTYYGAGATTTNGFRLEFRSASAEIASLRFNDTDKRLDLFIAGSLNQVGTYNFASNSYVLINMHVVVDNVNGVVEVRINGTQDSIYNGSTGSDNVEVVRMAAPQPFRSGYFDDLSIGTGGWPGDRRFDAILPNADATLEWDSTGANGYSVVDERPPNTSDYIYTTISGEVAIFDLASWTSTNKSVKAVHSWIYARETAAESSLINFGARHNSVDDLTQETLDTTFRYYNHVSNENPDTAAPWENAEIDSLQIKVEKAN